MPQRVELGVDRRQPSAVQISLILRTRRVLEQNKPSSSAQRTRAETDQRRLEMGLWIIGTLQFVKRFLGDDYVRRVGGGTERIQE